MGVLYGVPGTAGTIMQVPVVHHADHAVDEAALLDTWYSFVVAPGSQKVLTTYPVPGIIFVSSERNSNKRKSCPP